MSITDQHQLATMLEQLGHIQGVRAALVATVDGAFFHGESVHFDRGVANDISKTVRRMVVASATIGAALDELIINFGPARMMVVPIREEATLAIMLERDTVTSTVRALIRGHLHNLSQLFDDPDPSEASQASGSSLSLTRGDLDESDEVDALMDGELGPVLHDIQARFIHYTQKLGYSKSTAQETMREQIREWLLCCNPSPYTFPLLIDGLSQTLQNEIQQQNFIQDVQAILQNAKVWESKSRGT